MWKRNLGEILKGIVKNEIMHTYRVDKQVMNLVCKLIFVSIKVLLKRAYRLG